MGDRRTICFVCARGADRGPLMRIRFSEFLRLNNLSSEFHIINTGATEREIIRSLDDSDIIVKADDIGEGYSRDLFEAARHPENIITAPVGWVGRIDIQKWGNTIMTKIRIIDTSKRIVHPRLKPKRIRRRIIP